MYTLPSFLPFLPAGSACPPDLRLTPAFKRLRREKKTTHLSHHTREYVEACKRAVAGQEDNAGVCVPCVLTPAEKVVCFLRSKSGQASKAEIAQALPGASVRDVLYRLGRKGTVVKTGRDRYSLLVVN